MTDTKPEDDTESFTSLITEEDRAEYARLEGLVKAARAVHDPLAEALRATRSASYQLSTQYKETPSDELGQQLLASLRAVVDAEKATTDPYAHLNKVCGELNDLTVKLLTDKKLRLNERSTLFGGPPGPVRINYLEGWTEGEPYSEDARGGVVIGWSQNGCGFGTMTFYMKKDGSIGVATECMGPDFVKAVLQALSEVSIEE